MHSQFNYNFKTKTKIIVGKLWTIIVWKRILLCMFASKYFEMIIMNFPCFMRLCAYSVNNLLQYTYYMPRTEKSVFNFFE